MTVILLRPNLGSSFFGIIDFRFWLILLRQHYSMPAVFWRAGVISIAVLVSDFSIPPVNDHLATIVLGDFTSAFNCGALGRIDGCVPAIPLANDRPTVIPFNYMLIYFHYFPFCLLLFIFSKHFIYR
jgi:hypothetical protein